MNLKSPFAISLCIVLLVQMTACSQGVRNEKPAQTGSRIIPGQVIPGVSCLRDSTLSYALFLPKNYTPSMQYPLIIAFDPQADGKLPVGLFHPEAERYGYILAGSNNSENGLDYTIVSDQYEVMRRDILQRLSIDTSRIYTAGFSGGSRVATFLAMVKGGIAGVIGCSAGFPQIDNPTSSRFSYLGVVGNADFNFSEMAELDKALARAGFVHHLLVFDGSHSWPPAALIPSVFNWLELDAMRRKLKPADESFIARIKAIFQKQIDSLHQRNDITGEYYKCQEALQFLNGLADVNSFRVRASQLNKTARIKKQVAEMDSITHKERLLQYYYNTEMGLKGEKWWKTEVKRLKGSTTIISTTAEKNMHKRVLSYLSVTAYFKASSALKSNDSEKAGYYIRLYAMIDPTNSEAPYLEAVWFATQGKDDEALKSLHKALDLGFTDLERLESDAAFVRIKGKTGYETVINRITEIK